MCWCSWIHNSKLFLFYIERFTHKISVKTLNFEINRNGLLSWPRRNKYYLQGRIVCVFVNEWTCCHLLLHFRVLNIACLGSFYRTAGVPVCLVIRAVLGKEVEVFAEWTGEFRHLFATMVRWTWSVAFPLLNLAIHLGKKKKKRTMTKCCTILTARPVNDHKIHSRFLQHRQSFFMMG